jgi:hypothetical protein
MGENALALLQHLSSVDSPLPELTTGYTKPRTVFFSHMGIFFIYSYDTARIIYGLFFVSSIFFIKAAYVDPAPALKKGSNMVQEQLKGCFAVCAAPIGALVGANVVAFIMHGVLGKGMSWFSQELSCVVLFGPAALAGAFSIQRFTLYLITHLTFFSRCIGFSTAIWTD